MQIPFKTYGRQILNFTMTCPKQVAHNTRILLEALHDDLMTNCADLKSGAITILTTKPSKQQLHDFATTAAAFTALPIILMVILILAIMASINSTLDVIRGN